MFEVNDRSNLTSTAPAHGLQLVKIIYHKNNPYVKNGKEETVETAE
jgi:tRNA U38,U39,U40 pseudouridine synthase TruA